MKKIAILMAALVSALSLPAQDVPVEKGKYQPEWQSLSQWDCPEWFKDAKFGIWAHWGPQCEPEDGDWYARGMYDKGSGQYKWHLKHYGDPKEFGFKDVINEWKAENLDADALVKLYKSVGARYFMALGQHHDNFDLWDSPYQEWNSTRMGPRRDLLMLWKNACKKQKLPLGVSMHGAHTWTWYELSQMFDGNLTKADGKGKWWDGFDPQELYAQRHEPSKGWQNAGSIHSQWNWGNGASQPSEAYKRKFKNRVLQCINDYDPDMIYFDDTVLPFYGCDDQVGLDIVSHYYNTRVRRHGKADVVVMGKILGEEHKQAMLWDVERGIPDRPQPHYWQTCTCIGSWHYSRETYERGWYKSAQQVIDMLVDIVSKNGNLLLSVPIRGDGTIDEKERAVLMDIKAWMDQNGESIYGTRPWKKAFGEGPLAEGTQGLNAQGFNERNDYSARDVRYVERKGKVYATIMRWPSEREFTFRSLASDGGRVKRVKLLGHGKVKFRQTADGLTVELPSEPVNKIAPVFAVSF